MTPNQAHPIPADHDRTLAEHQQLYSDLAEQVQNDGFSPPVALLYAHLQALEPQLTLEVLEARRAACVVVPDGSVSRWNDKTPE